MGPLTTPPGTRKCGAVKIRDFNLGYKEHVYLPPATANKPPKPCERLQKSYPNPRETRQINCLERVEICDLASNFIQVLSIFAHSMCSWLIIKNSPEGYNSPKLDLLSYSPLPPSVTLLRKWSLRLTDLLMYRFWPMKTFQASLMMGLPCLNRDIYC